MTKTTPRKIEVSAGSHISGACKEAAQLARKTGVPVCFEFNGIEVTARPGNTPANLERKWSTDSKARRKGYLESPEYKEAEAKRAKEYRQKCAASMTEPATTEADMREAKAPWPYTKEQLVEYIESLVNREHDYSTACYAMSLAALAAFNYVAHRLGVTGFQASCADLDFIRKNRDMKGPFMLIKAEDALCPQTNPRQQLEDALAKWQPWLREQAQKELASNHDSFHPNVIAHLRRLAEEGEDAKTST